MQEIKMRLKNEEQETKLCKYCQIEIPKKATICPNCKKKQGDKFKWVMIAIIVLTIIIGNITSGSDNEKSDVGETTNQSTNKNESTSSNKESVVDVIEEKDEYIYVGDTFEKNGLKITLNEAVVDFQDYDNEYGWNTPTDGMKYIMASFTFENTSDTDKYVSIYDFDCYADNTNCEEEYGLDDDDFVNTNLSSGRNVSFKVYFEVPVDAESIELEYELNSWTNEKAIIKIQ